MKVNLDFETRSSVDLKESGLDNYARDSSTEVICMAYSIDGGEVKLWIPGETVPSFMFEPTTEFHAWNAYFEYKIMHHVLELPIKLSQMRDSMAISAACNMPQSLDDASQFLDTEHKKDATGKRLIQKLSKPQKDGTFNRDPELLNQMYEYCKQDVRTEMAITQNLRALSDSEQKVWEMTQRINEYGVPYDEREVSNAIIAVTEAQGAVDQEIREITGGIGATQPAKLIEFLKTQGLDLDNLTADTVDKALSNGVNNPTAGRVLYLRQLGSQTAVAKYEKIKEVGHSGRIRGTLIYHGASTGRWASRGGVNLQNIARPSLDDTELENACERILENGLGGSIPELASLVRSAIKAPSGYTFIDADFSSIENRVASWLANQEDKLNLFKEGLDEYKTFATQMYKVDYDNVSKGQRQIAKSAVLGSMFGQGAKGLVDYAEKMGVKVTFDEATSLVNTYRTSYAKVKASWSGMEASAIRAIQEPGTVHGWIRVKFKFQRGALWCQLPSGRLISWQEPMLEDQLTPWGAVRLGITVKNQNTYTRTWGRNKLIGSSIFQSAVQGTARDFLAEAALHLDGLGYEIVNLVHDEIMVVHPEEKAEQAYKVVMQIMQTPPQWAEGFPLAAEGWIGKRYKK